MNQSNAYINSAAFAQAELDSVSANVCIIDKTGIILAVNQRWRATDRQKSLRLSIRAIAQWNCVGFVLVLPAFVTEVEI